MRMDLLLWSQVVVLLEVEVGPIIATGAQGVVLHASVARISMVEHQLGDLVACSDGVLGRMH